MSTGHCVEEKTYVFFDENSRGYPSFSAMPSRHVQVVKVAFACFLDPKDQIVKKVTSESDGDLQMPTLRHSCLLVQEIL